MTALTIPATERRDATRFVLGAGIVVLALMTGYIHFTLGGLLFLLNAAGYAGLAAAFVLAPSFPLAFVRRLSWLVAPVLTAYTATTILAWAIQGPYFQLAYIAKGIEAMLIVLLVAFTIRTVGGPRTIAARLRSDAAYVLNGARVLVGA